MTSRNYRKQPYLPLNHTSGSMNIKVQNLFLSMEIALDVSETVTTEWTQHHIPHKHGIILVHNCKYPA
jgi:hypothetical protein